MLSVQILVIAFCSKLARNISEVTSVLNLIAMDILNNRLNLHRKCSSSTGFNSNIFSFYQKLLRRALLWSQGVIFLCRITVP